MMNCPNDHGQMERRKIRKALAFRGTSVQVELDRYVCPACAMEVEDPAMAAINQRAIADEYRKASHLLTSSEIAEGRKRLGISQEELARRANVGIASIKRWEAGLIQTRAMDDALRRALAGGELPCDPYHGNRTLSLHRIKLVLEEFNRILKRKLLTQRPGDRLLYSGKYLWYADMLAMRETGQSITGATYAALPQGPQLNNYKELVTLINDSDENIAEPLTDQEKRIIARVAMRFPTDQSIYRAVHEEDVWKTRTRGDLLPYTEAGQLKGI
jgi:putative zinc finger/helix-turn-helix YgiT family protein